MAPVRSRPSSGFLIRFWKAVPASMENTANPAVTSATTSASSRSIVWTLS